MKIEGTVTYLDFEGGFWGIIDANGNKFVPIEQLPDVYRIEGKSITAEAETIHLLGTTMWGTHVKLTSITSRS